MEKSYSLLKTGSYNLPVGGSSTSVRCDECSEIVYKPLLATLLSSDHVQTYYACPRCLSKVSVPQQRRSEPAKETVATEKVKRVTAAAGEDKTMCKNFFGYLKKRSKDVPIPDECLTCDKMIECMVR